MACALIVEDDPVYQHFHQSAVTLLGGKSNTVDSAEEAMERLSQYGDSYKIAIIDNILKGPIVGIAFAEHLHENFPDIKILMASHYRPPSASGHHYPHIDPYTARVNAIGALMLCKPFEPSHLNRLLREMLRP